MREHEEESLQALRAASTFNHPLPNLLELPAAEILAYCHKSQRHEFTNMLRTIRHSGGDIVLNIPLLCRYMAHYSSANLRRRLQLSTLEQLFLRVHDHVMSHPVWVHPFFVRMAAGEISVAQLRHFAHHYFNQVKNTRQCVALALGRFHTMLDRPDGELTIILSELTQLVLAGLLADEYGSRGHHALASGGVEAVEIARLFSPITHPELYRRFLQGLGDTVGEYDTAMLHGVADNVLVQRILSSDPAYSELEALASVGLGMEWGVPAFFSMIMAGILKVALREQLMLDADSMEIWSAHVRQDVEHAIAVMVATSFYVDKAADIERIENATNILMTFRYDMMSDIYREVFGESCANIAEIDLDPRYFLHDARIEPLLAAARATLRPGSVRDHNSYLTRRVNLPITGTSV